jgi:hypothetical protein
VIAHTVSRADGTFVFETLPPGTYSLVGSGFGYRTVVVDNVQLLAGGTVTDMDITLVPVALVDPPGQQSAESEGDTELPWLEELRKEPSRERLDAVTTFFDAVVREINKVLSPLPEICPTLIEILEKFLNKQLRAAFLAISWEHLFLRDTLTNFPKLLDQARETVLEYARLLGSLLSDPWSPELRWQLKGVVYEGREVPQIGWIFSDRPPFESSRFSTTLIENFSEGISEIENLGKEMGTERLPNLSSFLATASKLEGQFRELFKKLSAINEYSSRLEMYNQGLGLGALGVQIMAERCLDRQTRITIGAGHKRPCASDSGTSESQFDSLSSTRHRFALTLCPPWCAVTRLIDYISSWFGASGDPNDKTGPAGFGDGGFIRPGVMPYLVQFENDPDVGATLPAQEVFVTDELDADLDLSTLEFTGFGFNNFEFDVPPGLSHYETTIDLRPDGIDLLVHVVLDVDQPSRQLSATFRSLDPLTGQLPDDIEAGLLPVNDKELHNGEGFFRYRVRPLAGLPSGTEIINQASIVFDVNDPILTPTTLHTIDVDPPSSQVEALPEITTSTSFVVGWAGNDGTGSGATSYDVFVSTDGDPFELWLDDTSNTSAEFSGEDKRHYRFYSVATDGVGHVEAAPLGFDAETTVSSLPWHNVKWPLDVSDDGLITPVQDVLPLVNELNLRVLIIDETGALPVPPPPNVSLPPYLDVNGDNLLTPVQDVLPIINYINVNPLTEGEGNHQSYKPGMFEVQVTPPYQTPASRAADETEEMAGPPEAVFLGPITGQATSQPAPERWLETVAKSVVSDDDLLEEVLDLLALDVAQIPDAV